MTIPQMQSVRKMLQAAARSSDDNERRIGYAMLKKFDDFVAPFAPELADARDIYARSMRAQQLEQMSELAAAKSGGTSGADYAAKLRAEYQMLERGIIKGRERGWSPTQQAAISNVAQSGSTATAKLGKLAPTTPGGVLAAGVPAAVGTTVGAAVGGPVGAAIGGTVAPLATSAVTLGARSAAARATISDAEAAELLMRNGMPLKPGAKLTPYLRDMALRLLAAQTANSQR